MCGCLRGCLGVWVCVEVWRCVFVCVVGLLVEQLCACV